MSTPVESKLTLIMIFIFSSVLSLGSSFFAQKIFLPTLIESSGDVFLKNYEFFIWLSAAWIVFITIMSLLLRLTNRYVSGISLAITLAAFLTLSTIACALGSGFSARIVIDNFETDTGLWENTKYASLSFEDGHLRWAVSIPSQAQDQWSAIGHTESFSIEGLDYIRLEVRGTGKSEPWLELRCPDQDNRVGKLVNMEDFWHTISIRLPQNNTDIGGFSHMAGTLNRQRARIFFTNNANDTYLIDDIRLEGQERSYFEFINSRDINPTWIAFFWISVFSPAIIVPLTLVYRRRMRAH